MESESSGNHIQMNKRHWDTIAICDWPKKAEQRKQIRDGYPYLEKVEPRLAPYLRDIKGKKIVVLQFGDGLVLLACAKMGAVVTGVDLSGTQVRLAAEAAAYCGVNVTLIEADCQNLPSNIPNDHFDLAVAECGVLIWIQKVDSWMRNAYRVLRNGGKLVLSDFHPLSTIAKETEGAVTFTRSYFDQQPRISQTEENAPPSVEYLWKISDVINATVHAGFQIDCVEEYFVEREDNKVPLMPTDFLLVATKTHGEQA